MTILVESVKINKTKKTILNIPFLQIDEQPTLLLGANGAGKSTLFSVLAGRRKVGKGKVESSGTISVVEQNFNPIVGFSSSEYCAYAAWLFGQSWKKAKSESVMWLNFVNLNHVLDQRCESLSGGERSRLAIATALNSGAETLLLDEPSAALDPLNKQQITEIYQRIVEQGQNLVVSTHDAGELQRPFERIIVLDKGTIQFDGDRAGFLDLARSTGATPAHILARSFVHRRQDFDT